MKKINKKYHINRCSKLACGQSYVVPNYATVTAYRDNKTGSRKFKITNVKTSFYPAGGNLSFKIIKSDINGAL